MAARWCLAVLAGASLFVSAACDSSSNRQSANDRSGVEMLTVGSFDFAESRLLAEIYSQALEANGFRVDRAFDLGSREFVIPALDAGLIDFVPEYAGTALQFASLGVTTPKATVGATRDALAGALRPRGLAVLEPAPAQNVNALVVTKETAQRYALHTVSDLEGFAPQFVLGGPPECPTRPFCLLGLEETYGLSFKEFVPLDAGGPLTLSALEHGVIDVAVLFSTDPAIDDLVELADDRGLQPAENVTPLVRRSVVDRWGAPLVEVVDSVSERLTTQSLRALNGALAADRSTFGDVAAHWLKSRGIV
jgi:osmoprotectant transport system substrate-binding protein